MHKHKIFIVEDDEVISSSIAQKLNKWGFETKEVEDFHKVYEEFLAYNPSLVLLDISLPFYDGYLWCEKIRKVSKVPVIYISSMSENMNIIMAMNMGGDDFLIKPFSLDVLVAKVSAILRRTYDYHAQINFINIGDAILHLDEQTLEYKNQIIDLTKNEYRIIKTLFENKNSIVSRDELMQKLWETNEFIDDNTLTVNIARLRKKLEDINLNNLIETKKGQGYIIKDDNT